MVHHSLTKDGVTVSWQAIRRYHTSYRRAGNIVSPREAASLRAAGMLVEAPWQDIGYHAGVEMVNDHLEALLGRPETDDAAACKEGKMNALALHVCLIGNFDIAPPSDALLQFAAHYVIHPWMVRYGIEKARVVRHHDFAPYKTCPGTQLDMSRLRGML